MPYQDGCPRPLLGEIWLGFALGNGTKELTPRWNQVDTYHWLMNSEGGQNVDHAH